MDERVKRGLEALVGEEPFGKKMGIRLVDLGSGYAKVEMEVTQGLANIFGMCHGGAIFSLVDEAFQLACNAHGTVAVALNMSISYMAPAQQGSRLTAEAREIQRTRKTGHYEIKVTDERGTLIAASQALAYRKGEPLPFLGSVEPAVKK